MGNVWGIFQDGYLDPHAGLLVRVCHGYDLSTLVRFWHFGLKLPIHTHFLAEGRRGWEHTYPKWWHTDLVFGLWSEFIRRFVCAGLQISTSSTYNLDHPG